MSLLWLIHRLGIIVHRKDNKTMTKAIEFEIKIKGNRGVLKTLTEEASNADEAIGREVYTSHSHDRCPSCSGSGSVPTIR